MEDKNSVGEGDGHGTSCEPAIGQDSCLKGQGHSALNEWVLEWGREGRPRAILGLLTFTCLSGQCSVI